MTPDDRPDALERFVDRLYAVALRITAVKADAEAAIEEALHAMPAQHGAEGLLRRVAEAAHWKLRRRCQDVGPLPAVVPPLDDDGQHFRPMTDWSDRAEPLVQRAGQEALSAALEALPPDSRTALILHDTERLPALDIAEILRVDVAAVKLHVHRARLFVRQRLSAYFAADHAA